LVVEKPQHNPGESVGIQQKVRLNLWEEGKMVWENEEKNKNGSPAAPVSCSLFERDTTEYIAQEEQKSKGSPKTP
jgi:hypothetical protein